MPHELERFWHRLSVQARDCPHEVAVQGANERVTWAQLRDEVERRAGELERQAPAALILALDNGPQALLWDLAALFAGCPCVVIPTFFSPQQFAHCVQQSGATLALVDEVWTAQLHSAGFSRTAAFWHRSAPRPVTLPEGTAKITYTSGSTGQPKGVCLSAEAMLCVALGVLLENLGVYAALMASACVQLYPQAQLGISGATQVDFKRLLGAIALSGSQVPRCWVIWASHRCTRHGGPPATSVTWTRRATCT